MRELSNATPFLHARRAEPGVASAQAGVLDRKSRAMRLQTKAYSKPRVRGRRDGGSKPLTAPVKANGRRTQVGVQTLQTTRRFTESPLDTGARVVSVDPLQIVILGLSITSSWGNGHATTYRGLVRELSARGHEVLFLERDAEWYASNRDLAKPPYGRTVLYSSVKQLKNRFASAIAKADLVIVGSYVPEGAVIGEWVTKIAQGITAFYDIDTPVTLAQLARGDLDYLSRALIPRYALYLSFTGGPTLNFLRQRYGAPRAYPLYCSVDPALYYPQDLEKRWDCGYMGTYSDDRQPALDRLLLEPARQWQKGRFVVAGPQFPRSIRWPGNVKRFTHISPARHGRFYNTQKFTLNVTRAAMVAAGYAPSVRLFEAAACGTPIISDWWPGLDTFFEPDKEILIARSSRESLAFLRDLSEGERRQIGDRARARVLAGHTAKDRAIELENYALELLNRNGYPKPGHAKKEAKK